MKITLISPYPDLQSFGIRTISACLKQQGHDVRLLFLPKPFSEGYEDITLDEIVQLSKDSNLIGISLMTNFFLNAVQITEKLKENHDIPILWGGIHPTIRPDECLDYTDIVCIGEGEESIIELASKLENDPCCSDIRGMWFKREQRVIKNQIRPLIQNLDDIPFQDYDYNTHFLLNNGRIQKMDIKQLDPHYMTIPTRGCPFACSYCCNNTINKMYDKQERLRKRSINNVIEELTEIKNRLPFIKSVTFDDDSFFSYSTGEIKEFSQKYKEHIALPLAITGANPLTLTKEKLDMLVDAGLKAFRMGIQSGSECTKKLYKRHQSNQGIEKAVKIINRYKDIITPQYDIILDNPWESEDDLIETLMFLSKLPPPYVLSLFSLNFYPGTELYQKAKKEGMLKNDIEEVYRKHYHRCEKTYINSLFYLVKDYARIGLVIPEKIMALLTRRRFRFIGKILRTILKIYIRFFRSSKRLVFLLREAVRDIRKGDFSRIKKYTKRQTQEPV